MTGAGPKILVVNPNTTSAMTDLIAAAARKVAAAGTEVVGVTAASGVGSVESNADEVRAAVGVLHAVLDGEAGGADGYVIACFGDTGLAAAKEAAAGPVVGMTEAAILTASLVARRFAIVTLPLRTREQSHRALREVGMGDRCSVRAIDVRVGELAAAAATTLDAMTAEGRAALDEDGAEAIILGCAGLAHLVAPLRAALGVPVVEGVAAAVTMVEGLLAQGLSTSRAGTFADPGGIRP